MKNEHKTADPEIIRNEEKLKSVTGGEGDGTYRYRVRTGDFVYKESQLPVGEIIFVREDVDTNDPNRMVRISTEEMSSQYIGYNRFGEMEISRLYMRYVSSGGVLFGMNGG